MKEVYVKVREMKVKVVIYFSLKDSVRRRLEGYAALYKTKNRGRRREKNPIQ